MLGAILGSLAAAASAATIAATPSAIEGGKHAPRILVLTPAEMFRLAEIATAHRDLATASAIYTALEENPDPNIRAEAKFRHARQLAQRKQYRGAALMFRQILDEKPDAVAVRLELARVLDEIGDKDGAWRQVRAAQASRGLPPNVARLIDRYSEALRAQRPFGASIEIALAPDSNINRATRSDVLGTVLGDFQIDQKGKAKPGTGLALQSQVYRRLPLVGDADLLIRASGYADLYGHHAFDDVTADLAVGPELTLNRDRIQLEIGATQRWFGQKQFVRSARVGATAWHPLGGRTLLRLSGTAAVADNLVNHLQDGKIYSGELDVERALTPNTGVAADFSLERQSLRDPGYSTTGWRAGLSGWHDLGRLTVTVDGQVGRLAADQRLILLPDRREDRYSRVGLGVTFRQIEWRGFAPVARFSIERNRSDVAFYDYRRTRAEMGIVRAF